MDTYRTKIHDYWLEIKARADTGVGEWGLVALLCVIGLGSFGLGRLSVFEDARPPVSITQAAVAASDAAPGEGMPLGGQFVASSAGKVYYYPWCSGALAIKPESQVWFSSEAAAQHAGYRPAKSCKGLGAESAQ